MLSTAGYGKTEEIKNIAGYFSAEEKLPYPIKFSLRDYEGQPIEVILATYDLDWRNIEDENILLLFDGLDEIGEHHFQAFINHLNSFVEQNSRIQAVVSSRYNFYDVKHPQLREFEIYLLDPLTRYDIEDYITEKLGNQKQEFIQLLEDQGFYEYIQSPYYLTRLVRFYREKEIAFPKNKTELFDRILFEQLEKDEGKYSIPHLKENLLPIARQIAFCMTTAGKSTLTDEEIRMIISDQETKRLLNHFSIINRNATDLGSWAFEHKNLQEYLCASVFSLRSFNDIHKIISFQLNTQKLLPRFLNTVSFLFELISKESSLFQEMFSWINTNESELLIRFEKEQLSKHTRNEIFKRIFTYYKEKGITLRVSTNFSYEELARFVEIEEVSIDFLANELKSDIAPALVYDTLSILEQCKRPYLYKEKLTNLLFSVLTDKHYPDYVHAKVITTFVSFEFTGLHVFENILAEVNDLENYEKRQACIFFLNSTNYYEQYSGFILKSITVLEEGQQQRNRSGSFTILKQLILKFQSPKKIKELLQYCITDKNCMQWHSRHREFHFELNEVKAILERATLGYKSDKSILPVVYRLYCGIKYLSIEHERFIPFKSFFENTCGIQIIFMKFYRYDKREMDIMSFADEVCCEFLLEEYKKGNITDNEMIIFRNVLRHVDRQLFLSFYEKLKLLGNEKFVIEDLMVDYNDLRTKQKEKNQVMLLDQNLFLEEARHIFKIVAKENITASELWSSENMELRKFQNSIAIDAIRNLCLHDDDKIITKEQFFEKYEDQKEWDGFVIDSTVDLLKDKNNKIIQSELLVNLKKWCKAKIEELDFDDRIKDLGNSFIYIPIVEFVKDVFLLIELNLEDELLLKMLPSDYEYFYGWNESSKETISAAIIEKVKDKELLHQRVINNIKNGNLAIYVLCGHFSICHKLRYKECLPYLYQSIVSNTSLSDHDRVKLSDYYLDLGGEITDFISYLVVPEVHSEESTYSSWQWYLIEKLQYIETEKVVAILLQILNDPAHAHNRLKAIDQLIQLSRIEGLDHWAKYVKEKGVWPFEHRWSYLQQFVGNFPPEPAIDIFFSVLEFAYQNDVQNGFRGSLAIDESIYHSLITIAKKEYKHYEAIKNKLSKMISNFSNSTFVDSIRYYSERLTHLYYESQRQEVDIQTANLIYREAFTANP